MPSFDTDTDTESQSDGLAGLLDPASRAFIQDPYAAYAAVRDAHPVARSATGAWLVTGHDDVTRALTDTERFTSRKNLDGDYPFTAETVAVLRQSRFFAQGMFNADPPDHGRMRGLLADFFSPRSVRRAEPMITSVAASLIDTMAGDGRADLVARLAYPLPMRVICTIMGVPERDHATVKTWSNDWTALLVLALPPERQLECARSLLDYERYCVSLLDERLADPRDDVASVLAAAALGPDRSCSLDEAVVVLRSLLLAGHETTSGLIGNTVLHLLRTDSWSTLVARPDLIPAAVEEGLRFDPSAQSTTRVTTSDVAIGGVLIPAGSLVHPMTGALGRAPGALVDPDVFRVDRETPARHLAFGYGIHYCLGAALTRLEMKVVLAELTARLPRLRLASGHEPEFLPGGFNFHALSGLPVEWD
ncbi:cytochrome P450 [Frankia sp. CNm7]|uniref:Cytochrome P450 n=1 Tax=Frankia nepalensis TaxID=1836974 RepID=A0A937USI1_9ACTN|nr:cytochrome P450 [Frankia nepalensis]MBL7501705.1 cytochrome P450 [Frankia nepalensis]MBL7513464.1 cytochrome P450 [Frankia nepalensis]MBL7521100.1 cytochrome P450 [Frankia nepalensis]MBL7632507.1 cytochrome P450 [Frankia nepalensis]